MKFAVYGTLKKGYGNYERYLKNAKFLGVFKSEPKYTLYDGSFPIVEREGDTSIIGEVYETDDKSVINNVFALEGCMMEQDAKGSWYTYDFIETPYGEATMFVMKKGKSGQTKKLESGIWR